VTTGNKYIAYHVDLVGVMHASYELDCTDDEGAKSKGRYFLRFHSSIDVWQGPRWVARFEREEAGGKRLAVRHS
jgi:hypothetical protein